MLDAHKSCITVSYLFFPLHLYPQESSGGIPIDLRAAGSVILQDVYKSEWVTPSVEGSEKSNHRQRRDKK
ncbi:hypothetical protein FVER14953_21087 [Fusarium verticillioides]|nr:hypothetical protein FVER14953_21087 [Fusarium verticillioides]